jgi:cytoskeletal protein CcmA (bactofilin family)
MAEEQKPEPAAAAPTPPPASSTEEGSLDAPASTTPAGPAAAPTGVGEPQQGSEPGKGSGLKSTFNIYFIVFIVVVLIAVGVIIYAVSSANKTAKSNAKKTQSLTSQQISALKGNTTLVGDTKSTLDVQSNSVFEGEILARSDLSVAGSLKVGGNLALSNLSVSGTGTFGGLSVSGTSTFTGNTAVQGALSVQKGLTVSGTASFGGLSVGQLSVTSLQLTGDLSVNRHIVTSGGNPSRTPGTAVGGGGTVSVSGSDTSGTVTVNTGNNPPAGIFATITFTQHFSSTPHVIITPVGSAAGSINYYVNRDTSGFSIGTSTPPPAGSSFAFDYFVVD